MTYRHELALDWAKSKSLTASANDWLGIILVRSARRSAMDGIGRICWMKRKFSGQHYRLPLLSALACSLLFSYSPDHAVAADGKTNHGKVNKSAAKLKAASLLSAPMSASYDTATPRTVSESPPAAPPIENGRTRAHRLLKEGARLHRLGEYGEAERLFREAVANDPRNPDGFFNLGALAEGRGDLIDALTQYHAGLSLKPTDQSLKEAVESIEKRLAAGERTPPQVESERYSRFKYPPTMFSNPNPTTAFVNQGQALAAPILNVQSPDAPELTTSNDPPPFIPVNNNGPFQLNSTQNAALGNTGSFAPLNSNLNVNSSSPPIVTIRQNNGFGRRAGGGAFRAILNIGMSSALSGTGLHCPACRLLRF